MLFQTLDQSELQGDGVALSLEEQLCALSISEASDSDPKDTVSLNGSRFSSELFKDTRESTKVNIFSCTSLCAFDSSIHFFSTPHDVLSQLSEQHQGSDHFECHVKTWD